MLVGYVIMYVMVYINENGTSCTGGCNVGGWL